MDHGILQMVYNGETNDGKKVILFPRTGDTLATVFTRGKKIPYTELRGLMRGWVLISMRLRTFSLYINPFFSSNDIV